MMALEEFINQFHLIMDRSKCRTQYAYLRSTINSEEEAYKFVDGFAEKTNTIWIPQTGRHMSVRYKFYLSWFCNRSWRNRTTAQGDDCNAKIDIYVKKPERASVKYDEYLYYDPPLPCVIEIAGQHTHPLEYLEYKNLKGIRDQVKKEFFKYFQMGLSVIEARNKYTIRFEHKKGCTKAKLPPTLRQAQRLYNQWKGSRMWSTSREGDNAESQVKPVTFKEFLDVIPKREIMYSLKHLQSEAENSVRTPDANHKDIKFPLVFVSVGSTAAMPNNTAPLLYKLKHGLSGEPVSDLVHPRIYSILVDSGTPAVVNSTIPGSTQELQNPPEQATDEILGVPMAVEDSILPTKSPTTETLDIPIKLEPLNDGYEDEPSQLSAVKVEHNPVMPVINQTFSCGAPTPEEVDVKPNICPENSITQQTVEKNVCCDKAGNSFFPLVFTLKGSIYEASNARSLVYDLKQGSTGVQATEIVIPQISSVQINSLNEAAFQFKDASFLRAEGSLSISIQTESSEEILNTASPTGRRNDTEYEKDIVPVIINASSSRDIFPVIADSVIRWSKKPREDPVVTPAAASTNLAVKRLVQRKILSKPTETAQVTVTEIDKNDEDYLFLLSLLPELKRIPTNEKSSVKKRMKDILVTSRFATSRYQFEKKSTNIYRDCGVLPSLGGWKF